MKAKPTVILAKQQLMKSGSAKPQRRPPTIRKKRAPQAKAAASDNSVKRIPSLSKLLSPKNIGESVKTVTNLRSMVKNWMRYLGQADQVLDTLFVTTNSLKESGVLEKIAKQKGKNLNTEDFTNVLIALMNSPIGGQLFKGSDESSDGNAKPKAD